jgi:sugar O-acyltransferase (sialic acid O-acetyltransferase NeuD family)
MGSGVLVFGTGVAAEVFLGYALGSRGLDVVACASDSPEVNSVGGVSTVDLVDSNVAYPPKSHKALVMVGYSRLNRVRFELFERARELGYEFASYVHPSAVVAHTAKIHQGAVVMANSTVEPHAEVLPNTVVWANCVVGHHSKVGPHAWISAGTIVAGNVKIGERSFVGVGSVISDSVEVGDLNFIGAGAVVTKSTTGDSVYFGVSASKFPYSAVEYGGYSWEKR